MRRIFKYVIDPQQTGAQEISIPVGAQILKLGVQAGNIAIWALVDEDAFTTARYFEVFTTGERVSADSSQYLDTLLFNNGGYVVHVFEVHR